MSEDFEEIHTVAGLLQLLRDELEMPVDRCRSKNDKVMLEIHEEGSQPALIPFTSFVWEIDNGVVILGDSPRKDFQTMGELMERLKVIVSEDLNLRAPVTPFTTRTEITSMHVGDGPDGTLVLCTYV